MSNSTNWNLVGYVQERFPVWLALLLPSLLALAALRHGAIAPANFAVAFVIAALLVFELRLLDDLFDLEFDRKIHPNRVMCRSASLRPFLGLLSVLVVINFILVALLRSWWGTALLLALHIMLAAWYRFRSRFFIGPVANYHVVLLKYPLMVLLLGATTLRDLAAPQLLVSANLVYLAICVYEVLHDARLRALSKARICLAVECLMLAALGCLAFLSAA